MGVGCLSKAVINCLISWSESLPLCTQGSTGKLWQQNIFLARLFWSIIAQHRSWDSPTSKISNLLYRNELWTTGDRNSRVFFIFLLTYRYQGQCYFKLRHTPPPGIFLWTSFFIQQIHSEEPRADAYIEVIEEGNLPSLAASRSSW